MVKNIPHDYERKSSRDKREAIENFRGYLINQYSKMGPVEKTRIEGILEKLVIAINAGATTKQIRAAVRHYQSCG